MDFTPGPIAHTHTYTHNLQSHTDCDSRNSLSIDSLVSSSGSKLITLTVLSVCISEDSVVPLQTLLHDDPLNDVVLKGTE